MAATPPEAVEGIHRDIVTVLPVLRVLTTAHRGGPEVALESGIIALPRDPQVVLETDVTSLNPDPQVRHVVTGPEVG